MFATLTTERLSLRPFTESDLALLDQLHADPEVYRYLGDGRPRTTAFHQGWLARTLQGHAEGIGQRVVERDGRAIGRCGLSRYWRSGDRDGAALTTTPPAQPEAWSSFLEMGWTFERAAWGQGLASEAAAAVLAAFVAHTDEPVFAMIHVDNSRSIRVAERLGWSAQQRATLGDRPTVLYGPPSK